MDEKEKCKLESLISDPKSKYCHQYVSDVSFRMAITYLLHNDFTQETVVTVISELCKMAESQRKNCEEEISEERKRNYFFLKSNGLCP